MCLKGITNLLGFIVLKFYMQAVLNPDFHLDGGVDFRVGAECVNNNVQLLGDVTKSSANRCSQNISRWKTKGYVVAKTRYKRYNWDGKMTFFISSVNLAFSLAKLTEHTQ